MTDSRSLRMTNTLTDRAQQMYEAHAAHVQHFEDIPGIGQPRPWGHLPGEIRGEWIDLAYEERKAALTATGGKDDE